MTEERSWEPDAVRTLLFEAAKLRIPRFSADDTTGFKIDRLESYLLDTAYWRGELEEARLWMHEAVKIVEDQWSAIKGWEPHLRKPSKADVTQEEIRQAKREIKPDLYDSLREGSHLIRRLSDQIRRLENDDEVVSRAYTFLTGS